jgi:hypothetical protein
MRLRRSSRRPVKATLYCVVAFCVVFKIHDSHEGLAIQRTLADTGNAVTASSALYKCSCAEPRLLMR